MEPLCKTCCNGACPLQVTKDRLIFSCIEYIPGIMVGEIMDRSNEHSRKEIELASEVNSLKTQVEFIKGQANSIREAYAKVAKEALALAGEYKKENEEMKFVRFGKFVINTEEISNITYRESSDIADKEKVLAIIVLKDGTKITARVSKETYESAIAYICCGG